MTCFPEAFFGSREFAQASKDAVCVYMMLRRDIGISSSEFIKRSKVAGVLASGVDAERLSDWVGLPKVTVERVLDELVKRRWLKKIPAGVSLGTVRDLEPEWFLDSILESTSVDELGLPDALKSVEKLRRKVEEDRKKITTLREGTKAKVTAKLGFAKDAVRPKDILRKYMSLYSEKFGVEAPLVESGVRDNKFAVSYVYIGRALKWSASPDEVLEVLKFVFDNWDDIRSSLGIDGRPTLNMFGSSKLYPRFTSFLTQGIPKRRSKYDRSAITDRYDGDGKDVGW
jgi:hypothetical protein